MATPTPSIDNLLLLLEATDFTEEELPYSTYDKANELSNLLIVQKKLPTFYFAQAAYELNIPPHIYKYWRANSWSLRPIDDQDKLQKTLHILTKVHNRLAQYNTGTETYPQAMTRLKKRINALETSGISYNRISNHLHISFRTLSDISKLTYTGRQRPRHCPWEMLKRLETAENDIPRFNHSHILSRGAPRGKKAAHDKDPTKSMPNPAAFTPTGGPCTKCAALWPNLYHDGTDAHGNSIFTCRLCGKTNLVTPNPAPQDSTNGINRHPDTPIPVHQHHLTTHQHQDTSIPPYVQRYTNCWNCSAPWHNLSRDSKDTLGFTSYTCLICTETNIVPPKPSKSNTPARSA